MQSLQSAAHVCACHLIARQEKSVIMQAEKCLNNAGRILLKGDNITLMQTT